LHDLLDGLPQDDARTAQLSFAEIVASGLEVVILDLPVFKGELPGGTLLHEVMAIGMFAPSSVGTSVRHLVVKIAVVAGHAAPSGSSGGAKVMGRLTVCGEMIEPRTVRAMATLLILVLGQSVVLGIVTVPGDGTPRSSPQT
jgi:hypothetical protein